jgi:tRNA(Ile)-lysidine synthase
VAVALSGGADSAVAAWAAVEAEHPTRALHVHHGLPGSEAMVAAARQVAARLALPVEVLAVEGAGLSEGGLRAERYRVLHHALEPGEWLITGHTADDQAETVLANLLRGAGLEGLAGIVETRFPLARPLLSVTRQETRELATLLGLPWAEDPANLEPDPLRNRIRSRLLPSLEATYNPNLRARLALTAEVAGMEVAAIETGLVGSQLRPGEARLAAGQLVAVGRRLAFHSIRAAFRRLRPPYPPSMRDLSQIWSVVVGASARRTVGGGITALRRGPWLVLHLTDAQRGGPVEWKVPGSLIWGGFELQAVVSEDGPVVIPLSKWRAVVDADRVGDRLTVEPRTDASRLPAVVGTPGIIWAPGRGVLPAGWVDQHTRRYLYLSCWEGTWEP